MQRISFPLPTVERLTYYLRTLEALLLAGRENVSSEELARLNGLTAAQVRKDLAYFGSFGQKGKGYPVSVLAEKLKELLGLSREWFLCLVGLGNLGRALVRFKGFAERGLRFVAIFDKDPKKIGTEFYGINILDIADLPEIAQKQKIEIAVLTVPESEAKSVYEVIKRSVIKGVLNFTTASLTSTEKIFVKNVSIVQELESLTFYLSRNIVGGR
jgi:redox-sensing transcriptional repressor